MNKKEFEKFVLNELLSYLKSSSKQENSKIIEEQAQIKITPKEVKELAQEIKELNLELRLENPTIDNILSENKKKKNNIEQKNEEAEGINENFNRMKDLSKYKPLSERNK